jgi:hypothetical protein
MSSSFSSPLLSTSRFSTSFLIGKEINPLVGVPDAAAPEKLCLRPLWKEDQAFDLWKHYRIALALETGPELRPHALQQAASKATGR